MVGVAGVWPVEPTMGCVANHRACPGWPLPSTASRPARIPPSTRKNRSAARRRGGARSVAAWVGKRLAAKTIKFIILRPHPLPWARRMSGAKSKTVGRMPPRSHVRLLSLDVLASNGTIVVAPHR